ncbi:hypothetical protein PC9H_008310 [Pleurotus ostreatus]|uniref:DUF6534 domain-containing protein n=1 Tax=Pleurotus ostreatus TaxID=5322 RepID=A0A8H6ZNJ2_PLEOS|nr:uncharacterized protein PC9H_008310 [Pleurotus ostreatus]KAF7425948.1 hypothetical protein PC9H_008310 [Pleurotus ostreatus]
MSATIPPSLGMTLGAAYLGVVVSAMFLDAFHLALTIQVVYHYLVESFGNFQAQEVIIWSFKLQIVINVVIIILVQSLYAARVWKLGRHYHVLLPWVVIVVVAAGYGTSVLIDYVFTTSPSLPFFPNPYRTSGLWIALRWDGVSPAYYLARPRTFDHRYRIDSFPELVNIAWTIYLSFATSTFIDLVIATSMCFYLQRSRSGFSELNSRIVTLMQYVLASGMATSACSMAALIAYALLPNTLVFLGIEFLLTKLYINSFISMLNTRKVTPKEISEGVSGGGLTTDNFRTYTAPLSSSGNGTQVLVSLAIRGRGKAVVCPEAPQARRMEKVEFTAVREDWDAVPKY